MEAFVHANGREKEDGDDGNIDVYCDIRGDSDNKLEQVLARKMKKTEENGISTDGKNIKFILFQHWDTVRIRYNKEAATRVYKFELPEIVRHILSSKKADVIQKNTSSYANM